MIKNLIFDVYGTLVSTGKGSVKATAKIFREFGMEENAEEIYKKDAQGFVIYELKKGDSANR